MATVVVTPVALNDAAITISNTQFTYADIIWHLRRDSSATDDHAIFQAAYREHLGTWEFSPDWKKKVAEDLVLFQLGKAVPPYITARISGIMCAGK